MAVLGWKNDLYKMWGSETMKQYIYLVDYNIMFKKDNAIHLSNMRKKNGADYKIYRYKLDGEVR